MSSPRFAQASSFVRAAIALARESTPGEAARFAAERYGKDSTATKLVQKAGVEPAGARTSADWGNELADTTRAGAEFFSLVDEGSIVGRMAGGLRRMPMKVRVLSQLTGFTAHWRGENKAIPASKMTLSADRIDPLRVAAIAVVSNELLNSSDPAAEPLIERDMVRAVVSAFDSQFIDPDQAGVSEVSPAAVTYGAQSIASTGDPAADVKALIAAYDGDLSTAYFVCHPTTAAEMALAQDTAGAFKFATVNVRGGNILGIPLLTSRNVPHSTAGGLLALIDAGGIAYGEGNATLARTSAGVVDLNSEPVDDAPTTMVSMFQAECTGILVGRDVNWQVARANSVLYVTGASY